MGQNRVTLALATIALAFGLALFHITGTAEAICGQRLGKNVLICHAGKGTLDTFNSSLCTHISIAAILNCKDKTCTAYLTAEMESMVEWLRPLVPIGAYFPFDLSTEDFLQDSERRQNTVKSIVNFMKEKGFTYVQFFEYSWDRAFKNSETRNFFSFLKDLAIPVHREGWHLSITIEFGIRTFLATYDLAAMSRYVDWFNFPPHKFERRDGKYFYLGSYTPLTLPNNEPGSFQYWIEFVLQRLNPECVVIEISARGKKYRTADGTLEPGPGSRAIPSFEHVPYKDICTKIIDDRCSEYWSEEDSTPWAICGTEFLAFDNARSIKLKAELMAKYKIAGGFFFSLTNDDYENICGNGVFPNLRAMQEGLQGNQTNAKQISTQS